MFNNKGEEITRVFDELSLINFSERDLELLVFHECIGIAEYQKFMAEKYKRIALFSLEYKQGKISIEDTGSRSRADAGAGASSSQAKTSGGGAD